MAWWRFVASALSGIMRLDLDCQHYMGLAKEHNNNDAEAGTAQIYFGDAR
jgi:hypothetical protein